MKAYKIKKSEYTDFESLLKRIGLVKGNRAFPSFVYWNKKDLDKAKKELRKLCKKDFPHYNKKIIDNAVGMYMLNLSPCELKDNPLKDGYMLVDTSAKLVDK